MRKQVVQVPEYERVKKYQEYWDFVVWCSMPEPLKNPTSQRDFAKQHSMHESQLSRWKAMPEFRADLVSKVMENMSHKINNVMYSLENKIYKDGSAAEVRLFLEWVHKWIPEIQVNIKAEGDEKSESLIRQVAAEFEKKLKETINKKDA